MYWEINDRISLIWSKSVARARDKTSLFSLCFDQLSNMKKNWIYKRPVVCYCLLIHRERENQSAVGCSLFWCHRRWENGPICEPFPIFWPLRSATWKLLSGFREKLGREQMPNSNESVRYRVLKRAKGKSELCGMPLSLRPVDIDHSYSNRVKINSFLSKSIWNYSTM